MVLENSDRADQKYARLPLSFGDDDDASPGVVYRDLLILGGATVERLPAAPGDIQAYDVRTGEIRWTFRTFPAPGDFGADRVLRKTRGPSWWDCPDSVQTRRNARNKRRSLHSVTHAEASLTMVRQAGLEPATYGLEVDAETKSPRDTPDKCEPLTRGQPDELDRVGGFLASTPLPFHLHLRDTRFSTRGGLYLYPYLYLLEGPMAPRREVRTTRRSQQTTAD